MSSTRSILVLFAHPALQKSRVNRMLLDGIRGLPGVTLHDLYEAYPDFQIDVPREQELLRGHDLIVLQHPFYWYSCPALLKEWIDLVLQYNFAFGTEGRELEGKGWMHCLSTGGDTPSYQRDGMNRHTMGEFLVPFEQTARLCHMRYLAPFLVQGTHRHLDPADIQPYAEAYRNLLEVLRDHRLAFDQFENRDSANEAVRELALHTGR